VISRNIKYSSADPFFESVVWVDVIIIADMASALIKIGWLVHVIYYSIHIGAQFNYKV